MLSSKFYSILIVHLITLVSIYSSQAQGDQVVEIKKGTEVSKSVAVQAKPQHHAEDKMLQNFYKMAPQIEAIKQVCPWRSATARGVIRLMKVENKGAHKLYVQWVRDGIAGTAKMPLSTLSISEINDDHYFRFDLPEGRLLTGACSIETILEDIIDEKRFRLTLHLMGPGQYEAHLTRLKDATL